MNRKCSFERKVITIAAWLTAGFYYLHWPEEFRKAKDNKSIDERWGHTVWKFFPDIKNFILFFWKKKKIPKECMEIFGTLMPFRLNIFPSTHGLLEKFFLNPSISKPSEHDYTWNFKFSSLWFLHMAIVKRHSTHGETLALCQCFRGRRSPEEPSFLGN